MTFLFSHPLLVILSIEFLAGLWLWSLLKASARQQPRFCEGNPFHFVSADNERGGSQIPSPSRSLNLYPANNPEIRKLYNSSESPGLAGIVSNQTDQTIDAAIEVQRIGIDRQLEQVRLMRLNPELLDRPVCFRGIKPK